MDLDPQPGRLYTGGEVSRFSSLMMLSRTKRRWKAAAENALAAPGLLLEADRLAGEIAQHVWLLHGGAPWADAPTEGGVLTLQALTLGMLTPEVVTTSAALRYLSALEHAVISSDYEDVPAVAQELAWVSALLAPRLSPTLVEHAALGTTGSAAPPHACLRKELAGAMEERLMVAIAAA